MTYQEIDASKARKAIMSAFEKQARKGRLGTLLIQQERERQINYEGYTPEHDDQHTVGELAEAAAFYALPSWYVGLNLWPWPAEPHKKRKHDRIRQLAIAGAFIAAEIDRLTRAGEGDSN